MTPRPVVSAVIGVLLTGVLAGCTVTVDAAGNVDPASQLSRATTSFPPIPGVSATGRSDSISAISSAGDTVVAVGRTAGQRTEPVFLRSPDAGATWTSAGLDPASAEQQQVDEQVDQLTGPTTAGPASWVALGSTGDVTVAYLSADAVTWDRHALPPHDVRRGRLRR